MITGSSGSWGENSEAFLLKIDKTGAFEWSQHYGGNEADKGKRVLWNQDLGYFVAGSSNSFGNGDFDVFLYNTDANGNLQWQKSIDLGGWDETYDAIFTADSGLIVVGKSQEMSASISKGFVIRTNSIGDTIWSLKIGNSGTNAIRSVLPINDTLFVMGGEIFNEDSSLVKGFLCQMHINGNIIWAQEIGDNGTFGVSDITLNLNRINAVGWRWDPILQKHDNYTGRYELNGSLFYESVFVNQVDVIFDEVTLNGNLNKLYVGYRNQNINDASFGMDVALGRFNTNFDWDNGPIYINHGGEEKVEQFISTSDGGALAIGYLTYPMNGGNSIFAMKIGPNDEAVTVTGNEPMNPLLGFQNEIDNEIIRMYPNPFQNEISFKNPYSFPIQGSLISSNGSLVQVFTIEIGLNILQFPNINPGYYLFKFQDLAKPIQIIKSE